MHRIFLFECNQNHRLYCFSYTTLLETYLIHPYPETEDIKKRWQEYTELYKKHLHDPDNDDGVITHLEQDILECEIKWALESITRNKAK